MESDSKNEFNVNDYFTEEELKEIDESLADYKSGNYVTDCIDNILEYLHSKDLVDYIKK